MLMFAMCLSGTTKCLYLTLSDIIKKDFESLTEQFNHDYLQNNKWLNTTRLENRKLLNTESAEKYISDMSDLALPVCNFLFSKKMRISEHVSKVNKLLKML